MTTYQIPQTEGEYTPEEAQAFLDSLINSPNLASHPKYGPRGLKFTQNIINEWQERMNPLHARWRVTDYMLAGNTLCRSGPEDVHVPEIYKAVETIVPRVEEQILERDPWFRVIPRRKQFRALAETRAAYIDWLFDQARVRDTVQPAARNALAYQAAIWYVYWENLVKTEVVREEKKEWTKEGRLDRKIVTKVKDQVVYSGIRAPLVDPYDFIIDTKATTAQNAIYVGHRVWMTIDEIRRIGKQMKWANLGKELDGLDGRSSDRIGTEHQWPRDPTAALGDNFRSGTRGDGRPDRIELLMLYSTYDATGEGTYEDYQFVVSGGTVVHEIRRNQHRKDMRPYAVGRVSKNGHSFYGIGPLDNAIRLNQHLDRIHQITLRGAEIAASPMVFADEESNLPDSLYKIRPFQVFKGVGSNDVRFTTVPDGFLQGALGIIGMLKNEIHETTGAYPIQMGADSNSGTATEATLSLQEGNRRNRSVIRGLASGLEQLLEITDSLAQDNSTADVEFPVLGKRALDMRSNYATVNPADLLGDVKFDLVGLHSLRTYGLKQVGYQTIMTADTPLIVNNPNVNKDQLLYNHFEEMLGPEEAAQLIKVPTSIERLYSQEQENEGLIQGAFMDVDDDDPHEDHLKKMHDLWMRALDPDDPMQDAVRKAVYAHQGQHIYKLQQQRAQQKVTMARQQEQQQMLGPEAGGDAGPTGSAPKAGALSADMMSGSPGGQSKGETPGPPDMMKQPRPGRANYPVSQSQNQTR